MEVEKERIERILTSEESLALARRNIESLKKQAPELAAKRAALGMRPKSEASKRPRGVRGGRLNLNPTSQATLVQTLGGAGVR